MVNKNEPHCSSHPNPTFHKLGNWGPDCNQSLKSYSRLAAKLFIYSIFGMVRLCCNNKQHHIFSFSTQWKFVCLLLSPVWTDGSGVKGFHSMLPCLLFWYIAFSYPALFCIRVWTYLIFLTRCLATFGIVYLFVCAVPIMFVDNFLHVCRWLNQIIEQI